MVTTYQQRNWWEVKSPCSQHLHLEVESAGTIHAHGLMIGAILESDRRLEVVGVKYSGNLPAQGWMGGTLIIVTDPTRLHTALFFSIVDSRRVGGRYPPTARSPDFFGTLAGQSAGRLR